MGRGVVRRAFRLAVIFMGVLLLVLFVGGTWLYHWSKMNEKNAVLVRDKEEAFDIEKETVEYILADDIFDVEEESLSVEESEVPILPEESRGERLYREAKEKGQKVYMLDTVEEDKVTLLFAGDILLDPNYAVMYEYRRRGNKIEEVISPELLERMHGADLCMVNNEFTFSDEGEPLEGKRFTFRAKPEDVKVLHEMGVDIVSLANNHAYDYGEISLLDTLDTLDGAGIARVGAGHDLEEAMQPVYYIANERKIAIIGATQMERYAEPDTKGATADSAGVFRCMEEENLVRAIQEAKDVSDYVILYIHWGTENQEEIDWWQKTQSKIYADAGVDLIIGGHPHVLQKLDVVEGVPVVYSLGNFWFNSKTVNTCVVEVSLDETGLESMRFYPCIQSEKTTRLLYGEEREALLQHMRDISPNVDIDDEGYLFFG